MKLKGKPIGYKQTLADLTPDWWKARTKTGENGCIVWTRGKFNFGHGAIKVDGRLRKAHRVSWEIANGRPVPVGLSICHHCDNPACVNVYHLFLGTLADNNRDRDTKGRTAHQCGEAHGMCKLSDADVSAIRSLRMRGVMIKDIMAEYNISRGHCGALIHGRKRKIESGML
jgi:hypothetical protein